MPAPPEKASAVFKLFTIALMLTGDNGQAESVTCKAIAAGTEGPGWEARLMEHGIRGALRCNRRKQVLAHQRHSSQTGTDLLPRQLKAVLGLAVRLREVFVLRVLAGMPTARVADLLGMTGPAVHSFAATASILLSSAGDWDASDPIGEPLAMPFTREVLN